MSLQKTESVEIKANVAKENVPLAIEALSLADGKDLRIVFCEDLTAGLDASTPLLNLGVVLRARAKGPKKGDTTIKLRPCRWSQLCEPYRANFKLDDVEFKVEADWSATSRSLAASMTTDWEDGRLAAVETGGAPVTSLFSEKQRRFLTDCARERIDLTSATPLGAITSTRWDEFPIPGGQGEIAVRGERWQVAALDFLELSIASTLDAAEDDRAALASYLSSRGVTVDTSAQNKTQQVASSLAADLLKAV